LFWFFLVIELSFLAVHRVQNGNQRWVMRKVGFVARMVEALKRRHLGLPAFAFELRRAGGGWRGWSLGWGPSRRMPTIGCSIRRAGSSDRWTPYRFLSVLSVWSVVGYVIPAWL